MKNTKRLGIVIIIGLVLIALASAATWAASSAAASAKAFNAVDLPDGEYTPDNFAWSGGSGRLEYIRCNSILVENGGAYAELEFASAHYDYLKVMGKSFARTGASDDTATFRVPVKLNTNLEIEGRTTAMSQPHWIPYKIYIGKKGVKADGTEAFDTASLQKQHAAMKRKLLEEAPMIPGFPKGEQIARAQHLRLFRYAEEGTVIQVERGKADGEGVYGQKVVNYLILPEKIEAPAGIEKDFVIIPEGAAPVYVYGSDAIAFLSKLGVKTAPGGGFDAAKVVRVGTKLCVLPEAAATPEVTGKLITLGIPLFLDRAETDERGAWALAYGEIFGRQEEAVAQAAREQKQQRSAAAILLIAVAAAMLSIPAAAKRG